MPRLSNEFQKLPPRKRILYAALTFLVVAMLGCALVFQFIAESRKEIKIGAVLPLTGKRARFGTAMKRGIEMAIEDINRERLLGRKIICIFADDRSDIEHAENAVRKLIASDRVIATTGSYTNLCTLKVCETAEKMKTPHISYISSGEEISQKGYQWVFRLNAPASHYAITILDFLAMEANTHKIALLHETDNAGMDFASFIKKYAAEMNVDLVYGKGFVNRTPDFTPILREVERQKPEALLVNAHIEDAVNLMRDAKSLKMKVKAYAGIGSGFSLPDFIVLGKKNSEHTFSVVQWNPQVNWPGARRFAKKYRALYGMLPDEHSATAYATVEVLAACFSDRRARTRKGLRQALHEVDTNTIFGRIRFEDYEDYSNQNSHYPIVQQVQGGAHMIVWPRNLRNTRPVF